MIQVIGGDWSCDSNDNSGGDWSCDSNGNSGDLGDLENIFWLSVFIVLDFVIMLSKTLPYLYIIFFKSSSIFE